MSAASKSIFIFALIIFSSLAYAEDMTLKSAQRQVDEYQALRRVCTVSILDKKQLCFRELVDLTKQYKTAKRFIISNKPANEELALGFTQ
ncbi:MAG: hypothetical protein K6L80_06735 [Agarilytica sp.]